MTLPDPMSITSRMRRARISAALLCACSLLAACQDAVVAPAAANRVDLADPLAQRIAEMGFRADMIVDRGDHFLVEGDIVFRKADLARAPRTSIAPTGGPSFQYHTSGLILQSVMAQGIPVSLASISGNTAWTTAARSAMTQWNNTFGTKIKFYEVTTGADINVVFGTSQPGGNIATAAYPINGYPGWQVTINPAYNSLSASGKLRTMAHELGHTIGLMHTESASGTAGGVHVPNTPTGTESGSVMSASGSTWNGFTLNDLRAARHMYPVAGVSVISQGVDGAGDFTASWSAVTDASSYRIDYEYYYE
jgi:Dual-action HEIGH metallo-peptidase